MKQSYQDFNFTAESLRLIETLDGIVEEYIEQGYVLTVRQLYYQMVARGKIENTERSYKRITSIVNDARLAGLIDWNGIEDRTREFIKRSRWTSPSEILQAVAKQYHEDLWVGQSIRPFVIVEKEALAGVLQAVCNEYDVPLLAARGYPSGTVLREFCETDVIPTVGNGQEIQIIHLGDHDPSGIDMTRDLRARVELFSTEDKGSVNLLRVALNMPQIEQQRPPENPAKTTDSRFQDYRAKYGESSWELDALQPNYLVKLVRDNVEDCIDDRDAWDQRQARIAEERAKLLKVAKSWN